RRFRVPTSAFRVRFSQVHAPRGAGVERLGVRVAQYTGNRKRVASPIAEVRMPPSKPDDAAKDLLKALAELRDAAHQLQDTTRSIEDSARRLVQSVRTRTDHRAEFAPVRAADFTGLDLDFYARTASASRPRQARPARSPVATNCWPRARPRKQ